MASHAYDETISSMTVRHINGQLVDVIRGEIFPACVNFHEGRILRIERKVSAPPQYILPGLIDSHIHIESSLLTPYRFAEMAVVHGTTAVVTNPHEIANVMGMEGIRFMIEDGKNTPLRFYYTAPSSVPSTDLETSGGFVDWKDVREMLATEDFVALGEVMDPRRVLEQDPQVMAKIEVAVQGGKRVDGHSPGLRGYDLDRYIMAGISSDHECVTLEEAEEKHRKGMTIMVREGSAAKNLEALLPFASKNRHLLVTDDLRAADLMNGHMDGLLRKAVAGGMDPVHAVRAATMWPSEHYRLPGGSLYINGPADMVVVSDLKEFRVLETWIGGELIAREGSPLFLGHPKVVPSGVLTTNVQESDLRATSGRSEAEVRVIMAQPDRIASPAGTARLPVEGGTVMPDPLQDILLLAVVNRYVRAPPAVAFIHGFGLRLGAMASSVAHDSHNLIGVGTDYSVLATAINEVAAQGGGLFASHGTEKARLELPIAGLMSALPCREVAMLENQLTAFVRDLGCPLPTPFATLSFQSLLTVPELKLSDRGLVDTVRREMVATVIGERMPQLVRDESP
jgi:adenine deaminase